MQNLIQMVKIYSKKRETWCRRASVRIHTFTLWIPTTGFSNEKKKSKNAMKMQCMNTFWQWDSKNKLLPYWVRTINVHIHSNESGQIGRVTEEIQ